MAQEMVAFCGSKQADSDFIQYPGECGNEQR